ncbi:MAG: UDP-N-acetylmuramoyl-L-alanine--D-glutamate ligase [Flavobacteriaceae bacterium]|nr:UDP-N-acetylmuramoyl-L-alanine--D-glutamate ligase [Flavobacteriaceae bacterium]
MNSQIVVIGGGESGVGAAYLAKKKGINVFLSERNIIENKFKKILKQNKIDYEEGGHTLSKFLDANEIIKSPGIPENIELLNKVKLKKIPIISEIEFAFRFTNSNIISVTGSNGKTTTCSLIFHILKNSGLNVGLGGNIGNSFSFMIAKKKYDYIVLELSSFQLENISRFRSFISVLTNLSPDHLERYDYSFKNYINSKFNILLNQNKNDFFIYNGDDQTINYELEQRQIISKKISFSQNLVKNKLININVNNSKLMIPIENLSLKGNHNIQNSMAAATVAKILNISDNNIRESLGNFKSIEHRLEHVLTIQKVKYINDSKATNVNAVYYALDSMKSSTIWIAGGVDKGNNYNELIPLVREKVKAIICIGIDNTKIIEAFSPFVDQIIECNDMLDAVKMAYKVAKPKNCVLLSPACSSFDLFKNYEDRGIQFKNAVRKL